MLSSFRNAVNHENNSSDDNKSADHDMGGYQYLTKEESSDDHNIDKLSIDFDLEDKINKVLESKLLKYKDELKKFKDLDTELDDEIRSLIEGYDFDSDPMDYSDHPTIGKHPIYLDAYTKFMDESTDVNLWVEYSMMYRYDGNFFSTVWGNCKLPDDSEKNIRAIIIYDQVAESQYVIKNPANIASFMESYLLPPYYKSSLFSKFMNFNNNSWRTIITVYTDKYIYEGSGYNEDYVNDKNVTVPFTEDENDWDMSQISGQRQHFMFYRRNIE